MPNPYRTSAPREPLPKPKGRISWARLGAGAALVAAVVPLRAPLAPSEPRRETTRRALQRAAREFEAGLDPLPQATLEEARARIAACPEATRSSCREAIVRDIVDGAVWARRPEAAAFRPLSMRGERLLGP